MRRGSRSELPARPMRQVVRCKVGCSRSLAVSPHSLRVGTYSSSLLRLGMTSSCSHSRSRSPCLASYHLDTPRPRRILVILQIQQDLPHLLLGAPLPTASLPLPTQIRQFRNSLPARPARGGILAILDEIGGLACGLGLLLVGLAVVGVVEVVDVAARLGNCFGFFCGGGGVAAGEVGVTLFAPFSGRRSGG